MLGFGWITFCNLNLQKAAMPSIFHDQSSLFESSGAELALLVRQHLQRSEIAARVADTMDARGFHASVKAFEFDSLRESRQAVVCETALQFERLAGLV